VERGSRMMTKLRGTESARILHRRRDHRNASITPIKEMIDDIQEKVCLEWRDKITPHIVSRSASAHYRQSISNGTIVHHQEWKTKEIQFEKLVIQSIFPIEMILNKYFLENPSSANNPNILHQPLQTTAKYAMPTSTCIMGPHLFRHPAALSRTFISCPS
jgi:hypothetical protein